MGHILLPGNPPIEIVLRRTARARRLSLRVSQLDGRVTLSLPNWTSQREANAFAMEKEHWIRRNLASQSEAVIPRVGSYVLFYGRQIPLVSGTGRAARFEEDRILVPGDPEKSPGRVAAFLKLMARQNLAQASDHYAAALGISYAGLSIRDTRSRWGSCTSEGNLMYSWRLVMAPPKVLDYVAAHEVSHLVEMNHSAAYWKVVAGICPDYQQHRRWLRVNGQSLHAFQFRN